MPSGWDREGFDPSAGPQHRVSQAQSVLSGTRTATMRATMRAALPCGNVQVDRYYPPGRRSAVDAVGAGPAAGRRRRQPDQPAGPGPLVGIQTDPVPGNALPGELGNVAVDDAPPAQPAVGPWASGNQGLGGPHLLAHATVGFHGTLVLVAPTGTPPGRYAGTVTFTVY